MRDFNYWQETLKGSIAWGGAVASAITLNHVVAVVTLVYTLVLLWNAGPKAYETYKYWRAKRRADRGD